MMARPPAPRTASVMAAWTRGSLRRAAWICLTMSHAPAGVPEPATAAPANSESDRPAPVAPPPEASRAVAASTGRVGMSRGTGLTAAGWVVRTGVAGLAAAIGAVLTFGLAAGAGGLGAGAGATSCTSTAGGGRSAGGRTELIRRRKTPAWAARLAAPASHRCRLGGLITRPG